MANSEKGEDCVGSNSSAAEVISSSSESPAAASSSSPTIASPSSSSFFFQSISAELDGQLQACPPTTTTSANSTELLSSLPKWESWLWWRWSRRPITTSTTLPSSTTTPIITRPSTCRQQEHHQLHENFQHPSPHHYHQQHHHRQRLNSLTIHLTVVLIFTTLACFPSLVGSVTSTSGQDKNESLVCMKGISNAFPGVTYPRGDIFLEEGDMLEIYCKLNLTHPATESYNASSIDFIFSKSDIPLDQVEKRVLNETTAVVRVKHMNASNPLLQCVLKRLNGSLIPICQNQIDVGHPPLPVEDFRCVAREWKSLNCTWKLPWNPVPTKYTVSQIWKRNQHILCPNATITPTSCVWDGRTEPHYRPNTNPINLRLNGSNPLNPNGTIWTYKFTLATIVIPEKPTLHWVKLSPNHYMLNWTFVNYEHFPPGLNHRLTICFMDNGEEKCNVTMYQTKMVNGRMATNYIKNVTLPYAYKNYTIKVNLKTPDSNNSEEWWSEPDVTWILTDSRAPDFPPEADIASFETTLAGDDLRHIQLRWKSIPEDLQNGPNFNYTIQVYENKSELDIQPDMLGDGYAKFMKMKTKSLYHFYITASNAMGKSHNASEITVLSVDGLPGDPRVVSMIDYRNESYDISWRRPGRYDGIVSYTVFRCASSKPHPDPCEGRLEWDRVEATKFETMHKFYNKLSLKGNHQFYQFAVSANTNKYGSGMVWAGCTSSPGIVPGKLRSIHAAYRKEDEILIKWSLDCAYRPGDIEGFKITYCEVEGNQTEDCKDEKRSQAVERENSTTYRIVNLKPYSLYMIYVEILAAAGLSPKSDAIYVNTTEGAPSPATVLNVRQITNVSAVLGIQSPKHPNGQLREYTIYYKASSEDEEHRNTLRFFNDTHISPVKLENLRSNSDYKVYVIACTTKCSNRSEPFTFRTQIGYTNLTAVPQISWEGGDIDLVWDFETDNDGGGIQSFDILMKKNGDPIGNYSVEYSPGTSRFSKQIKQECEPSTNFTACVRAVTVRNGTYLYGFCSPTAHYKCGGKTSWLVYVILVVVALVAMTVFGYLSFRGYNYFRRMKDGLAIKLPPGLNSELNGFAHKTPPRSRSNDNGKEMYAYPLQPTSTQLDESKDFLSSSDLNQGEAEESLIEKPLPYCPSPTNPLLGGLDFSSINNMGGGHNPLEDDEHDVRLTEFTSIHPDRCSSPSTSTYKKLGVQSNGSAILLEPKPGPSSRSTPSLHSESGGDLSTSSPSHNTISQISNHRPVPPPILPNHPLSQRVESSNKGINRTVPDVLNSSPSSPNASLTSSSILSPSSQQPPPTIPAAAAPVAPPQAAPAPPPSTSYVRWTTLVPDMRTGDAGGVLENGSRQAPYCQVGILLDS